MGYLPEALLNYLARLGWSHGDDEVMSIAQMTEWFDITDVNKGAARFDFAKLEALNGIHMRSMDDAALTEALLSALPYLPDGEALAAGFDDAARERLLRAMPGLKDRAKTLIELADNTYYLTARRPLQLDEKATTILDDAARAVLKDVLARFQDISEWNAQTTEAAIREYAESSGLKLGKIAQPLRAALTGRATSPGVFDVLDVLGREESLARIGDQID
jgi:glutamyl-tRNA synthetase